MGNPQNNIVFSTTRQWNPGDEVILLGVLNLFRSIGQNFNTIIFNRNPDINPPNGWRNPLRNLSQTSNPIRDFLAPWLRIGHHDNSWKPTTESELCSLFVFAGTPEWSGRRLTKMYQMLERHAIPTAYLGIGSGAGRSLDAMHPILSRTVRRALLISARDSYTQEMLSSVGSVQLPCPALFAAKPGEERVVNRLERVGLIYASDRGMKWQSISPVAYQYMSALYKGIANGIGREAEVEIVCHYIDEIAEARRVFPNSAVRYEYDAARYLDIYRSYDLVIGPRVHGIGAAASVGVPGILVGHDGRADTAAGFQARILSASCKPEMLHASLDEVAETAATLAERATALRHHKTEMWNRYRAFLEPKLKPFLATHDQPAQSRNP